MVKYRGYFWNRKCQYCKRPAKLYRYIGNKPYLLCGSDDCDRKSRIENNLSNNIKVD